MTSNENSKPVRIDNDMYEHLCTLKHELRVRNLTQVLQALCKSYHEKENKERDFDFLVEYQKNLEANYETAKKELKAKETIIRIYSNHMKTLKIPQTDLTPEELRSDRVTILLESLGIQIIWTPELEELVTTTTEEEKKEEKEEDKKE